MGPVREQVTEGWGCCWLQYCVFCNGFLVQWLFSLPWHCRWPEALLTQGLQWHQTFPNQPQILRVSFHLERSMGCKAVVFTCMIYIMWTLLSMKRVNCSWRMERHPMKSQPQAAFRTACWNPTVRAGWTVFLLQICPFILDHEKTIKNIEKCLPCFLKRGILPGTAQDLEDTSLQYWVWRDRRTLLVYSKGNIDQDLHYIFPLFYQVKFLQLLFLEALQASSEFWYAQTWATAFMCH